LHRKCIVYDEAMTGRVIVLIEAHICEVEVLLVVTNRSGEWKVSRLAISCKLHCVHFTDLNVEHKVYLIFTMSSSNEIPLTMWQGPVFIFTLLFWRPLMVRGASPWYGSSEKGPLASQGRVIFCEVVLCNKLRYPNCELAVSFYSRTIWRWLATHIRTFIDSYRRKIPCLAIWLNIN